MNKTDEFDFKKFLKGLQDYEHQWKKKLVLDFLKKLKTDKDIQIERIGLFVEFSENNKESDPKQPIKKSNIKIDWE